MVTACYFGGITVYYCRQRSSLAAQYPPASMTVYSEEGTVKLVESFSKRFAGESRGLCLFINESTNQATRGLD